MATITWLGNDGSGNNNYWAPVNFSLTPYSNYDSMVDVPGIASSSLKTDTGNIIRGNYNTWNPLTNTRAGGTISNGNLKTDGSLNNRPLMLGTQYFSSGKWYCEIWCGAYGNSGDNKPVGITTVRGQTDTIGSSVLLTYGSGVMRCFANSNNNSLDYRDGYGNTTDQGAGQNWWVDGFWIGFAVDVDNNTMSIYKNGTLSAKVTNCNLAGKEWTYFWEPESSSSRTPATGWYWNFGQQPFVYTPPAGYKGLCTSNLSNPVIKRPSDHFDVKTYLGNGTSLMVGTNPKQLSSAAIYKSLRFKRNSRQGLVWTPGVSATSNQKLTYSAWIKRSTLGGGSNYMQFGLSGAASSTIRDAIRFGPNDFMEIYLNEGTSAYLITSQAFKDTTAWYHIVIAVDTTQVSPTNRIKLFVNGAQITSFSTNTTPSQNYTFTGWLVSGKAQHLGQHPEPNYHFDGYMADVHVIDGQQLDPTNFGQFDANNNWAPKTYTGTYGTNGFKLNFNDARSPTTAAYDVSGNNNHFTPTTFSGWNTAPTITNAPNVLYYGTPGTYTWTAPAGVTSVSYLVVAGGGGGGGGYPTITTGGGGGAGGMLTGTLSVTPSTSYTVTVGTGGTAGSGGSGGSSGGAGGNSVFASITATGGGYGAWNQRVGGNGGSGGGASGPVSAGSFAGGTGTAGQGNNGGTAGQYSGAGGGGAGGVGQSSPGGSPNSQGGVGAASSITGVSVYYAGGGGGGGALGGLGGGGAGSDYVSGFTFPGTDGLGGGGGGGGNPTTTGAKGGSGVVILSYTNAASYVGTGAGSSINNDSSFNSPVDTVDSDGNIIGNYCVWAQNSTPVLYTTAAISDGGLLATGGAINTTWGAIGSLTIPTAGKWYWEVEMSASVYGNGSAGISSNSASRYYRFALGTGVTTEASTLYSSTGYNTSSVNRIGIAYDADAGKMWFTDTTGAWLNSKTPGVDTTGLISVIKEEYTPFWFYNSGAETNLTARANFGQSKFVYTQPTGFKALNTKNLKDVGGYNLPDSFGNFVNTPDLVWTKARTGGAVSPRLYDTVRGPGYSLGTNSTGASGAETNQGLTAFLPNGFQLNSPNGAAPYGLENNYTYVAWAWNRGKIPGFDIVQYSGDGTGTRSIPHNLGQTPAMVIVKGIVGTRTGDTWRVKHKSLSANNNLELASTGAQFDVTASAGGGVGDVWSSTTFQVKSGTTNTNNVNELGTSYIAYLWAEVPGFSKFGSYVGNGAADGPFIHCGFKPKYVMIKRIDSTDSWVIEDSVRDTYNPNTRYILAENAAVEGTTTLRDFLSNGFKIRSTSQNVSTATYVYVAFAEAPFKYASAR